MEACPICQSNRIRPFFNLKEMPVSIGVQWPSKEQACACRKGDLSLAICLQCGFIWNQSFDPAQLEYSLQYDNALDISPLFKEYALQLASRLIETYGIRRKQVVELGCGKGYFLNLLCEKGDNHGVGFDPSYEGDRVQGPAEERIEYVQDFYGEKYTKYHGDLICCRHVFEHIADPMPFLSMVRKTIGDRISATVYFEVPNVRFILEQLSIWDIIYEHCNYFSTESLSAAFRQSGFQVLRLEDAYRGQFLSLEARLASDDHTPQPFEDPSHLIAAVEKFSEQVRLRSEAWIRKLDELQQRGSRTVIWGGGAKAVSFLNMLKVADAIPYVVDINPHKQGRHIPGTGQQIVSPDTLKEFRPDSVILMNPIYRNEVEKQLREMGLVPEILDA